MGEKLLFGVDSSETSRAALAVVGDLLKSSEGLDATIFHCATPFGDDETVHLDETVPRVVPIAGSKAADNQRVLSLAKDALVGSGFDSSRVSTALQEYCSDPAVAMLHMACNQGYETIALARRKRARTDPSPMGSVAYRLVYTADKRAIWLVDPPLVSKDVLVALVGAPISRRVMEHVARYFGHLRDERITFMHVVPRLPPAYWDDGHILKGDERKERIAKIASDYGEMVKDVADIGREMLLEAGVPRKNVKFRVRTLKRGMARDIIREMERGRYGILVIGRRGSRNISRFPLGSKAAKLLHSARGRMVCIVN